LDFFIGDLDFLVYFIEFLIFEEQFLVALALAIEDRAFAFNFFKTSICVYSRPNIPLAPLKGGNNYWDSPAG
jgi:hypothetical protein